jgi:hypothetical protein
MDASWAREVAWRVERRAWMWGGAMTGLYGDGVDIFGGMGMEVLMWDCWIRSWLILVLA